MTLHGMTMITTLSLSDLMGTGPINALIIFPGSLPSPSDSWVGRIPISWGHVCSCTAVPEFCNKDCSPTPLRYKAVMRTSVWMNFCFNSIWLLAIILLQRNSLDNVNVSEITMDCDKKEYLEPIILPVALLWKSTSDGSHNF